MVADRGNEELGHHHIEYVSLSGGAPIAHPRTVKMLIVAALAPLVLLGCQGVGEDSGERSTKTHDERAGMNERASLYLRAPEAEHRHKLDDLLVWRHNVGETMSVSLPPNGVNPNPLVVGDLVVASIFGLSKIVALDRQTGDEKWSIDLPDWASSHVRFVDGVLYAQTSRTLYALDPLSGKKKWEWTPYDVKGEWIYSSPAVAGDRLFIGDRNGVLHCLSTTTGKLLWWAQASDAENRNVNASAVVVDNVVITATNSAYAIAYATNTGHEVWRQELDSGSIFQVQRLQDNVVVQSWNSLYILSPRTGAVVRKLSWPERRVRTTTVAGATLVTITEEKPDSEHLLSGNAELRGFSGADALYSREHVGPMAMLRFDAATGMVYESRHDGIGIIDPATGRRIHHITSETGFWPALPDVDGGTIYALASEVHIPQDQEKPRTRMGVLVALRHP